MGRMRTGITTGEVRRIELSYLLKKKFIDKGRVKYGTLNWNDDSSIGFQSSYTDEKQFFRIYYTLTDWHGKKHKYDYKIKLAFIPSNLGKGKVPYFVCPASGKRCRILYKAYGSHVWKHREAYSKAIFYKSQTSSQYNKYNDEFWELKRRIDKFWEHTRYQTHYKGKPTRRYKKYIELLDRLDKADMLRYHPSNMPKSVRAMFTGF